MLRVAIAQCFLVADCYRERSIHVRESYRGAADRRSPDKAQILGNRDVLVPASVSGVKQANHVARGRVGRLGLRTLAERAGHTCESKVIELGCATVSTRLDVIDVKRGLLASLRQAVVLTVIISAFAYAPGERVGDSVAHFRTSGRVARRRRSVSSSDSSTSPSASARSSSVSRSPASCLSNSACSLRSTPSGSANRAKSSVRSKSICTLCADCDTDRS